MHNGNKLGDGELSYETAEEAALALASPEEDPRRRDAGRGGEGGAAAAPATAAPAAASGGAKPKPPRAPPKPETVAAPPVAAVAAVATVASGTPVAAVAVVAARCRRPAEEAPQGDALVGMMVQIKWDGEDEWYDAEVLSYDAASKTKKKFKVRYTEADEDGSFAEEDEALARRLR